MNEEDDAEETAELLKRLVSEFLLCEEKTETEERVNSLLTLTLIPITN